MSEDTAARDRAASLLLDQIVRDHARTGRAEDDDVRGICLPPTGTGVPVPRNQGGPRDVNASGDPRVSGSDATALDPVDPLTGELVVEHVDFALPSFGVPFAHRRTYRSRVNYDGPLGPGWDFSYNQRIVEAPSRTPVPGGETGRYDVPLADVPPEEIAEDPTPGPFEDIPPDEVAENPSPCGPVLLLMTGAGTTLRFRERAVNGDVITYDSDAADLTLIGHGSVDGTTWELRGRGGDVRQFDHLGHLVTWHDTNEIGLDFTWEPGIEHDWRLARVTDSVGRRFDYQYDASDRLLRVSEATSGLFASYSYGPYRALETAKRSDGKSERYQYDVQAGRGFGDWVPERMLEPTCELECSVSGSSCDAGGACDAVVAAATHECLSSCPSCAAQCTAQCEPSCRTACNTGPDGCDAQCDQECNAPSKRQEIEDNCEEIYDEEDVDTYCHQCSGRCELLGNRDCSTLLSCVEVSSNGTVTNTNVTQVCSEWDASLDGLGDGIEDLFRGLWAGVVGFWDLLSCLDGECNWDDFWENIDQLCDDDVSTCCTTGDDCGQDSCNRNLSCEEACRDTFLGRAFPGNCPAPMPSPLCAGREVPSPANHAAYQDYLADCGGTASEWAMRNGCIPTSMEKCVEGCGELCEDTCVPQCTGSCAATCATECHVPDCASYCVGLDLPGECRDACTTACVDDFHARGPFVGPKYGFTADLQFNLVRIYDGNGALYLENTYGTDIASPDFDTVVHQQFGEHKGDMNHVDLANGGHGTASWSAPIVETLADYDAPAICHYGCEATPPPKHDLAVPWHDVILVFNGSTGASQMPVGGWSASSTTAGAPQMAPTFISLAPNGTGTLAHRFAQGPFDGGGSLVLSMAKGKVTLAIGANGAVSVLGTQEAIVEMLVAGGITVFGDGTLLRAYPGSPDAVVTATTGTCSQPFSLERVGPDEVTISPAGACSGDLWIAPVASRARDLDAAALINYGQNAITQSHFRPSSISPVRAPTILTASGEGRFKRSTAASKSAVAQAATIGLGLYESAPIFSAPLGDNLVPGEPIYVFHQSQGDGSGTYPPLTPPSDVVWAGQDTPDEVFNPPCDPMMPAPPIWGTGLSGAGTKPVTATAIKDLHGARWTLYADREGHLIRQVNHDTGASRWMEYDPDGRVTGVLEPDGARQCLKYDNAGNVSEVLSIPAFNPNLPTPEPVRQRYAWTSWPSRLAVVMDPRDLTRELRRMEYDALGNLRSITEVDGMRTTVSLVGGVTPARAMPATIVSPGGAVQQIAYDVSNGTVRRTVRDATGASPVIAEVQSDAAGRPVWTTSPLGLVEGFEWDGPDLAAHTWDSDGLERREDYVYDDDAQLTNVASGRKVTSLTYDAIGTVTAATNSATDNSVPVARSCRRNGADGRVLEEVSAEGLRTRYQYDGEGRVTSVVAGNLGASPLSWDDLCPTQANATSVVGTIGTYQYDTSGRVIAMVDGRGLRTTWEYDGFGRAIIERRPDASEVRTGYDLLGNVVWQAVYTSNVGPYRAPSWGDAGLMAVSEVRYDLRGRPLEETRWHFTSLGPVGDGYARTTYLYDELSRTVTVTDDLGRATQMKTDGAGRPIQVRLPDGSLLTTAFLDGGRTVRTTRNGVGGQVVEIQSLAATGAVNETSTEVSGVRRVTSSTTWQDPFLAASFRSVAGAVTAPRYDAFERVVGSTVTMPDGNGEKVDVVLDRDGRMRSRSSVASFGSPAATWQFGYDALGRVVRTVDPAGAATDNEYVGATDLVWTSVDAKLVRTTNSWAFGGWLAQSFVDAPTGDDVTLTFSHDSLGRMLTASRRDGATTAVTNNFAWDSLSNAVGESDNTITTLAARTHGFDGAGQRVSSTYGTQAVSRTFDLLGRQTSLKVGAESPSTATWTYGAPGGPTHRQLRNGVTSYYGYDALSRLTTVNDWKGSTSVAAYEWELPLDGVPRRMWSQQRNFAAQNRAYAIDTAGRLTAEQLGVASTFQLSATDLPGPATTTALNSMTMAKTQYALDGRNNWLSKWNGSTNTFFTRDTRDALTAIGSQSVSRDAIGAMTGDGATNYRYDALGMLSEVRPVAGGGRIYKRDALGRIVSETDITSGAVTRFAWDGAQRVAVKRPDGSLETTLAAEGLDQPVVTIFPNGARRYFHQDRQGSVYAQTDDTGVGQLWITYTAYGEPSLRDASGRVLPATGVLPNFGYHGLPHDFGLGLVDMRARTYRPTLGRFLSPDPIGLLGDANLFAFVNSGPLTWTDPFGLTTKGGSGRVWGSAWEDWEVMASSACLADPHCSPDDDRNGIEIFADRLATRTTSYGRAVLSYSAKALDPRRLPDRIVDQTLIGVHLAQGAWAAAKDTPVTIRGVLNGDPEAMADLAFDVGLQAALGRAIKLGEGPPAPSSMPPTQNQLPAGPPPPKQLPEGPPPPKQLPAAAESDSAALGSAGPIHVTPQGVALPAGGKYQIPPNYVENPYRPGSYGDMVNGKFVERLRIDPPTPPEMKGPNYSHYHLNGRGRHYSPRPGDPDPGFPQ